MGAGVRGMTAADWIVEQLRAFGVHRVFGVAGAAVFPVLAALSRQNGGAFVGARHEEGAALMASAHAKLTGELGVCLAAAGPGAAHLAAGLHDAQCDGVPVLALTGEAGDDPWGAAARQAEAQTLALAACSGWSRRAATADEVPDLLAAALRFATVRQEVAHLALPLAVQAGLLRSPAPLPPGPAPYLRRFPAPDEAAIAEAAEILGRARRPGVLLGRGAAGLGPQVLALAERLQAPVAASLAAKGVVPDDHPLAVGVLGEAGSPYSAEVFADRDAVAVLGSTWWPPAGGLPTGAAVVQVDTRAERMGWRHPLALGITADLAAVLPALTRRLPERPGPAGRGTGKWGWLARQDWAGWEGMPLHPARLMAELRTALPQDAVVCLDTGLVTLWYGGYFPARHETTLLSGRWRTAGFGLPAALACKLARPERAVVALCGDGGFGRSLPEVLTAAQHGIAVTAVVLNNATLGEEAARISLQGLPAWGTDLGDTDFAAVARAAGIEGVRVGATEEVSPAVRAALASGRPAVVDVPTTLLPPPSLRPAAEAELSALPPAEEMLEAVRPLARI